MKRLIACTLTIVFGASLFSMAPAAAQDTPNFGCTPAYWRNAAHFDNWLAPFDPTDKFHAVFRHADWRSSARFKDAFPRKTLLQVLRLRGDGKRALGRQVVASLLNAAWVDAHQGEYVYNVPLWPKEVDTDPWEVIRKFNQVYRPSRTKYSFLTNKLKAANHGACPKATMVETS